ncbi:unnamed protein product [Brassica rapa]|uniref:Cytochrome P450 n=2 Tax=Brassica TaxID=3705 RepID=A0A3P5YTV0_BRACM|nr:unnamed protein product [Brassica napus]CAG7875603.1 unnamed protein product [Brassica rapa]CDY29593.1 BnaA05g15770D [Brassica napus]VDC71202.1 unnamed protein product [Brassica rapa]
MAAFTVDFQLCFIAILVWLFSCFCLSAFFFKKRKEPELQDCNLPPSPPSVPVIGHLHLLLSVPVHKSFQKLSLQSMVLSFTFAPLLAQLFWSHRAPWPNEVHEETTSHKSSGLSFSRADTAHPWGRTYDIPCYVTLFDKATKKEAVDVGKEMINLTNNTICRQGRTHAFMRMIMGSKCSEENGEADQLRDLLTKSLSLVRKFLIASTVGRLLKKLGISLFEKEIMEVSQKYDELLEKIIKEREDNPNKKEDRYLIDVLLEKMLKRLREEIESVVGKTKLIQEIDRSNLSYLLAVVKEGLRLHPHSPIVVRNATEGCKIGGFYIPQNTTMIINTYAVMRDPDSWEEPDEFQPERFMVPPSKGNKEMREQLDLNYIPFGSGRRGCPGSNLGSIFVGLAIGTMVHCFDWSIDGEKVNMEEAGDVNLSMAHPL